MKDAESKEWLKHSSAHAECGIDREQGMDDLSTQQYDSLKLLCSKYYEMHLDRRCKCGWLCDALGFVV